MNCARCCAAGRGRRGAGRHVASESMRGAVRGDARRGPRRCEARSAGGAWAARRNRRNARPSLLRSYHLVADARTTPPSFQTLSRRCPASTRLARGRRRDRGAAAAGGEVRTPTTWGNADHPRGGAVIIERFPSGRCATRTDPRESGGCARPRWAHRKSRALAMMGAVPTRRWRGGCDGFDPWRREA